MRYTLLGGVAAKETATPPSYNKEGEGGGVIAVIIITKYIIKQTVRGGGGGTAAGRSGVDIHPSAHTQKALKRYKERFKDSAFSMPGQMGRS